MSQCKTCEKRGSYVEGCKVLTERIGEHKDCFAYSDDPEWETKAKRALRAYKHYCESWWKKGEQVSGV